MLVECLSIGRAISLPAIATASSSVAYIASSAYARIRRQFNQELLDLEGIKKSSLKLAASLSHLRDSSANAFCS